MSEKASVKENTSAPKFSIRHQKNAPKTIRYKNRKYFEKQVQSFNAVTYKIHVQSTLSGYTTHIERKECVNIVQL